MPQMPTVFLSYSRADLPLIEQLEAQLTSDAEIAIWRDQDKIYGGQKWPKVLGEAIADQDVFLLAWSEHAAASHFVEVEWTTAIALKKTIVPCRLDGTPLPPSLRATHAIPLAEAHKLRVALTGAEISADTGRRTQVIRTLSEITATEETAVLAQAKSVFAQQQWAVQGNVYQAARDIHIHNEPAVPSAPEKAKPFVEKWQTWVGLIVAILTAATLVVQVSKNLEPTPSPPTPAAVDAPTLQLLSGAIRNEANEPLADVQVSLPQFTLTQPTDQFGQFRFEVKGSEQSWSHAGRPGYSHRWRRRQGTDPPSHQRLCVSLAGADKRSLSRAVGRDHEQS
jgi:hypothetical protein